MLTLSRIADYIREYNNQKYFQDNQRLNYHTYFLYDLENDILCN